MVLFQFQIFERYYTLINKHYLNERVFLITYSNNIFLSIIYNYIGHPKIFFRKISVYTFLHMTVNLSKVKQRYGNNEANIRILNKIFLP